MVLETGIYSTLPQLACPGTRKADIELVLGLEIHVMLHILKASLTYNSGAGWYEVPPELKARHLGFLLPYSTKDQDGSTNPRSNNTLGSLC